MIKVIAFDFIGVLVNEKDIELSTIEDKIEREFGDNFNDYDFLEKFRYLGNDDDIINITKDVINKLYIIRDKDIFKKIKNRYNVKIIIATNNLSYVKEYISNIFDMKYISDIIVSADINMIKPNSNFYNYILDKYGITAKEMLFLDDNSLNIEGANRLGINTIKVNRNMDLYSEIVNFMELNNSL